MVEKTGFTITSTAFKEGDNVPPKFTADGPDVSPALHWANPPAGTKSFALICDDPDAPVGLWTHWLLKDIPASATGIEEGKKLGTEVVNSFDYAHYGGPAPPSGTHRYFFRLYAMGEEKMAAKNMKEFYAEVKAKSIGKAELMGKYARTKKSKK